jgi:hypothetical protein
LGITEYWIAKFTVAGALGSVFRELILAVGKEIGLDVTSDKLGLFVRSRNSLAHAGQFECVLRAARKKKPRPTRDVIDAKYLAETHRLG